MKKLCTLVAFGLMAGVIPAAAQSPAPLTLVAHYAIPTAPKGDFDHLAIDLAGHRLFATVEGGAVAVVDLRAGKLVHTITNGQIPHAILFRPELNRLYVTDGGGAVVRVYNAKTYQQVASVKLWDDLDSIGYDSATHYLYTESGGGDLHQSFSHFSTINTTTDKLVNDTTIDGTTLEAMRLSGDSPLIYFNNRDKGQIDVMDRNTHKIVASWAIAGAKSNVAMAYDEADHRLFVGCRSGQMVIFDTASGKQLQSLPVTPKVDDMVYDRATRRIYAAGDGYISVYQQTDPDHYVASEVKSAPMGKTALLVPALHRYFVSVPQHGTKGAEILAFKVN